MIVQSRLGRMRTSSPAIHLNLPLCVRLFQRVNQRRVDVQVAIESKEIDQQIASCSLCAADALSLSDIEANVIIKIERRDHLSKTIAWTVWTWGRKRRQLSLINAGGRAPDATDQSVGTPNPGSSPRQYFGGYKGTARGFRPFQPGGWTVGPHGHWKKLSY